MAYNKRKKRSRQRGSWTHGWGAKKKHRGKGNKGGSGMAGTGKRSDSKRPSIWKDPYYFGKHGFVSAGKRPDAVNIQHLNEAADSLVERNLAVKKDNVYEIDLARIGFAKLIGKGRAVKKFKLSVLKASKSAVESVRSAGGEVIIQEKGGHKEEAHKSP